MDHPKSEQGSEFGQTVSTEEDNTPIEKNESDEWKQFIHEELERMQNREKMKQNHMTNEDKWLDQTIASILAMIPFERLVKSAEHYLNKTKSRSTKKSKRRPRQT
jgi:hypothetical protein